MSIGVQVVVAISSVIAVTVVIIVGMMNVARSASRYDEHSTCKLDPNWWQNWLGSFIIGFGSLALFSALVVAMAKIIHHPLLWIFVSFFALFCLFVSVELIRQSISFWRLVRINADTELVLKEDCIIIDGRELRQEQIRSAYWFTNRLGRRDFRMELGYVFLIPNEGKGILISNLLVPLEKIRSLFDNCEWRLEKTSFTPIPPREFQ